MNRKDWIKSFEQLNWSERDVLKMNEEVFRDRLKHIIDAGLIVDVSEETVCHAIRELTKEPKASTPSSKRITRKNTSAGFHVQFTGEQFDVEKMESDLVRADQNAEYEEALKTMRKREQQEEKKRIETARHQEKILSEMLNIKKCAEYLGEEPADGIKLCIRMPSNKRLSRIFNPEDKGSNVYTLVAGQDEMFDDEFTPAKFELKTSTGAILNNHEPLKYQLLTKREVLNVVLLD